MDLFKKEYWVLDNDFENIRINGIPFLERSFDKNEDSVKVIKLASKSAEMLELLQESLLVFNQHSADKKLIQKISNRIEQFVLPPTTQLTIKK